MPQRLNQVGIYLRLSRDDERTGESMSIEHQRIILRQYVAENGGVIVDEYVDDGWSGTTFDRPEMLRMLGDAQAGKLDTVLVKDLSRFGRNYIQVGQYIDYIFPAYGIRFIALGDNIDTADRGSSAMDMMPIMNVFNEWHAANTSKKIRAVLQASQRAGKYTNWNYPYGYRAGTDEQRTAVVDEEAAANVRRIFDLRLQGLSYGAIARLLTDEGIPNPATYFTKLDGEKSERRCSPYWVSKTVRSILTDPTYIGKTVQHKTTSVSYKNHKTVNIPQDERIVRENAHTPIIDGKVWEKVQAINSSFSRGRVDAKRKIHPLSGLLICPDCGKRLRLRTAEDLKDGYVCRTYKDLGKKYCTSHFISESTLETLVLRDLRAMMQGAKFDEERAKENFSEERKAFSNRHAEEKQFEAYKKRINVLEKLIRSAFEEKILGKMAENVYVGLVEGYQAERDALAKQVSALERKFADHRGEEECMEEFLARCKKFLRCETLTREMCLQLIDHIFVGERGDGAREINIYYKFRG